MRTSRHMDSSGYYLGTWEPDKVEFALTHYRHLIRMRVYVDENIDISFRLSDVANAIGISSSRLSHLFLEKTGGNYSEWIRYTRIKKATRLLNIDDRAISDVAAAVGYENTRTFERAFKKVIGKTATEFREIATAQILSQI